MAIITAAEYKTWRSISVTTYDALIAILIASAQAAAERWCGRLFDTGTRVQYWSGSGGATLQVNAFPITDIDGVSILISTNSAGTNTVQALTFGVDYNFDANTGIIYRTNAVGGRLGGYRGVWPNNDWNGSPRFGVCPNFPVGIENIIVDYTGGYATYPDDLKMAMYMYVDFLWSSTWANAVIPAPSIGAIFKEKIDRHEYEIANLDDANIKVAVNRGLFLTQAKLQEFFGTFRRGDLQ